MYQPVHYSTQFTAWKGHQDFGVYLGKVSAKLNPSKSFVELGTHYGDSYFSICQGLSSADSNPRRAYAIDTWTGDPHAGKYDEECYAQVVVENAKYPFSTLIRSTFDEAVTAFADRSIQILHIDGFHTYEAVSHDFSTWVDKVSEDGIILLHDTQVIKEDFGVYRFFQDLKSKYDTAEFLHSHGLGIVIKGNLNYWMNVLLNRPAWCNQEIVFETKSGLT